MLYVWSSPAACKLGSQHGTGRGLRHRLYRRILTFPHRLSEHVDPKFPLHVGSY